MREDLGKFLFVGLEKDKQQFFKSAQEQGIIHFINPSLTSNKDLPQDVQQVVSAIKVLRGLPPQEQEENYSMLDAASIVRDILHLHERNEQLQEDIRVLTIEISRIDVYGNFSFEDIAYIEKEGQCKIQFFVSRPNLYDGEEIPDGLIFIVNEHELDYYMAVNDDSVAYEKMIELKFDNSLSQLKQKFAMAEKEHHQIDHELKGYAKYNEYLHHILIDRLNHYHLFNTQTYVQEVVDGSLFAIEGWVPQNRESLIGNIVDKLDVYWEEVAIEPDDVVPTCLENEGQGRLGEDLVNIYDTPSSTDKDPSRWVLYAFTLFFAFIIGDAGYGLVFLLLALFLRYKYPNVKKVGKRVLNLFTLLSVGCIVWGTLMTSFFGMQIDLHNPLRKVSLLQWLAVKKAEYLLTTNDESVQDWVKKYPELSIVKDPHQFVSFNPGTKSGKDYVILDRLTDNIMFELALFVGVVHLILSLARYSLRNWNNIGWIIFLIGAYLYFPFYLKVPSFLNFVGGIDLAQGGAVGFQMMFIGIGLAWVLSIIKHGWIGLFEVVTLIQVFADTLSYLRLYALGLAGAIVANTINEIASGLPLLLGILLILCSHFVNVVLSVMSGIIHGLRLNFLEWYHYSFEGGGKQFQPLRLLKKD
jgi:V/A-type H+-transporting ATPase subunit I